MAHVTAHVFGETQGVTHATGLSTLDDQQGRVSPQLEAMVLVLAQGLHLHHDDCAPPTLYLPRFLCDDCRDAEAGLTSSRQLF